MRDNNLLNAGYITNDMRVKNRNVNRYSQVYKRYQFLYDKKRKGTYFTNRFFAPFKGMEKLFPSIMTRIFSKKNIKAQKEEERQTTLEAEENERQSEIDRQINEAIGIIEKRRKVY